VEAVLHGDGQVIDCYMRVITGCSWVEQEHGGRSVVDARGGMLKEWHYVSSFECVYGLQEGCPHDDTHRHFEKCLVVTHTQQFLFCS
jgi:hypothetical protein